MSHKFEEKFDEFFKNLDGLGTAEGLPKMESFVHDALGFFDVIRTKLASENEEDRKEAMEWAQKLQEKLMEQTEKALAASGMDEEKLKSLLGHSSGSEEDKAPYDRAKKEIEEYQASLYKTSVPKVEGIKQSAMGKQQTKAKDNWIPG